MNPILNDCRILYPALCNFQKIDAFCHKIEWLSGEYAVIIHRISPPCGGLKVRIL